MAHNNDEIAGRTRPVMRSELIQKGLLKPAESFFRLHPTHPERERYCTRLILGGIDPWVRDEVVVRGRYVN